MKDRFEKCEGCKFFNPNIIEEHCSHDPETWNPENCYEEEP